MMPQLNSFDESSLQTALTDDDRRKLADLLAGIALASNAQNAHQQNMKWLGFDSEENPLTAEQQESFSKWKHIMYVSFHRGKCDEMRSQPQFRLMADWLVLNGQVLRDNHLQENPYCQLRSFS
jgi:hypothetical protein